MRGAVRSQPPTALAHLSVGAYLSLAFEAAPECLYGLSLSGPPGGDRSTRKNRSGAAAVF